jgi:hypothetical protein
MLREQTGADVILGRPEDMKSAIYVWPWRLYEDWVHRPRPVRTDPATATLEPRAPAPSVDFLVLDWPALTFDGLSRLDEARRAIYDHPILKVGDDALHVSITTLSLDQLSSLFSAARIPLTVCVSATLTGTN